MRLNRFLIGAILLCTGCAPILQQLPLPGQQAQPITGQAPTLTPFRPLAAETAISVLPATELPAAPAEPTATQPAATVDPAAPLPVWVDPLLPEIFRANLTLPPELAVLPAEAGQEAGILRLEPGNDRLISRWVYALVAPFPTQVEGVSSETLRSVWTGAGQSPWGNLP